MITDHIIYTPNINKAKEEPTKLQTFNENLFIDNEEMLIALGAKTNCILIRWIMRFTNNDNHIFGNTKANNSMIDYIINDSSFHRKTLTKQKEKSYNI